MTTPHEQLILTTISSPNYHPLKQKALARKLQIPAEDYARFRESLKALVRGGKLEYDERRQVRLATLHNRLLGIYRSARGDGGYVRPRAGQGRVVDDVRVPGRFAGDAAPGDLVQAELLKNPRRGQPLQARVVRVIERAASHFVGQYFCVGDEGFVRVDGATFDEPIYVGDAGAKDAKNGDKVVFEMLRFPSARMNGEGVITEILGPRGQPGVDLQAVIRQFQLPDAFPEAVLAEAREQARLFAEQTVSSDRVDLTQTTVVTIDPADARDFDDAVSIARDDQGHWSVGIHIADVATFVPEGSQLDREARMRGTSVYLPRKVLPMLPELISNGLASLQEGRVRLTKTVFVELDPSGNITETRFANSAIQVSKRLTYDAVMAYFTDPAPFAESLTVGVRQTLDLMRELATLLRERRRARGLFELNMPEVELEYDDDGRISGAHYRPDDEAHRVIEEFMLTANEAVAQKLADEGIVFLRRQHDAPDPRKLVALSTFLKTLEIRLDNPQNRFALQQLLRDTVDKPHRHAVHYALLRSLKEAVYSPNEEGHYALASDCYCHFTSPIRRYPDLTIHRLLDQWVRLGKADSDLAELRKLGDHCSATERRAEKAERELVRVKLLEYLSRRVGEEMDMMITGVEPYGFYAQGIAFPAEGLVPLRSLTDDFYRFDRDAHTLMGRNDRNRFRLGDRVRCAIAKVDHVSRQVELRLVARERGRPDAPGKVATDADRNPGTSPMKRSSRKPAARPRSRTRRGPTPRRRSS